MKKVAFVIIGFILLGLPGLVRGQTIKGTDHDFSSRSWNTAHYLCQICHTPHHASTTRLIWNHKLSASNFTWGTETTTQGGTKLPGNIGTWGGMSKYCLSCHDGTVAVGDLYHNAYTTSEFVTGDAVVAPSGSLAGNHPISIPYPYQLAKNTYNTITTGDGVALNTFVADPTTTGIRLYNDDGAGHVSLGAVATKSGIECGSCHNPHDNTKSPFLRVTNDGNQICLSCHNM